MLDLIVDGREHTYQERRVLAVVEAVRGSGWDVDAYRFATWVEATRWLCVRHVESADFYQVPVLSEDLKVGNRFVLDEPDALREALAVLVDEEAEAFSGEADSPEGFAESLYEEAGEIPETLGWAIDWRKVWDQSLRYDFVERGVWAETYVGFWFWRNQ